MTHHFRTAAHVFRDAASRSATKPALRQGDHQLTYAQLAGAAGRLADWLRAEGVGRGDVIATLMDRSHRCMIAVLGAWALGAAYVHIDATEPEPRIASLLQTTGARVVLTDQRNQLRLPSQAPPSRVLTDELSDGPYEIAANTAPSDVAYLVGTSGSTGAPKAVAVQHSAVLNYHDAFWRRIAPTTVDSFGVATTFAADLGKVSVYGALLSGGRLDVYDRDTTLDPAALGAELRAHPTDGLTYAPSQLEALAREGDIAALLPQRVLVLVGEPFPPRLARTILDARPDLAVYNGYGPAEATIVATMHRITPADTESVRVPISTPLAGVVLRVLDEDRRATPDGTPGVLYLGGACVAQGYVGEPGLTAEKFVHLDACGEHPAGRFYRTDDLVVHQLDGTLDYLGRADRQLKVRGNRVEPADVETALLALPGVTQAVATGERTEPAGPLELVAYVVGTADPWELSRGMRETVPSALVPTRIVVVPSIPVTTNGKADFAALRAQAGVWLTGDADADRPRTNSERMLAEIWRDVLGRPSIGRNDRFLEIGGDSFKALTVFGRLRRRYPRLVIAQLYAHATIAELAAALDEDRSAADGRTATTVEL